MPDLGEKYQNIMTDIKNTIKNPEEAKFIEEKMAELSMMYINMIDKIVTSSDDKINELEDRLEQMEVKMEKLNDNIHEITSDIYEEDEFDFEIVCPYCNHQFVVDINDENNLKEVKCPECKNLIELDWNEEEHCSGHCESCSACSEELEDFEDEQDENEDM